MPINIKDKGGQDFDPIPAGVHQAVCYGVVDIGTQKSNNPQHKPSRKLIILFELPFERAVFGDKGELPRGTSVTLTQSLSEKAILRKMLKSWRGRDFTAAELDGFDPKVLIGVNCQLNIVHETKGDKTYANITSIMPLSKGQEKQKQENRSLYFSLDEHDVSATLKFPDNMPTWMQKKIAFCDEVMEATGGAQEQQSGTYASQDDAAARERHEEESSKYDQRSQQGGGQTAPRRQPAPQENLDEDVPF